MTGYRARTVSARAPGLLPRALVALAVVGLLGGGYLAADAMCGRLTPVLDPVLPVAVVALAFLPLYRRVERLVDRLVHGERPSPYRVLARLAAQSGTSSATGPDLAKLAESVGEGLGARMCRITVKRPGLRDGVYTWAAAPEAADTEQWVVLPVRHGAELIGSIAVNRSAVAGQHHERRVLFEDVADSLGAILRSSQLSIDLERQLRAALAHAEEIAVSRRQAVAEMDNERRMIERDLHDGAQHHLVSLGLALGLLEHEIGTGKLEQATQRLTQLTEQLDTTEAVLAKTASGVSSIGLADSGIAAALAADVVGADPPIALCFDGGVDSLRFPAELEEAVYFCCLEAINNARKHARGAAIEVRVALTDSGRTLRFQVHDDGPGFDPTAVAGAAGPGRGMRNVAARIRRAGGRLIVQSAPGAGTTVGGEIPVSEQAPVEREPEPAAPEITSSGQPGLRDLARALVRQAAELYPDGPERDRVNQLAAQLDAPVRVCVLAPPGGDHSGPPKLPHALHALRALPVEFVPTTKPDPQARGALLLHDQEELIELQLRDGTAAARERAERLISLRDVPRLARLLTWHVVRPEEARTVRAVLAGLEDLAREHPRTGAAGSDELLYQVERVWACAHELIEIELAEALRCGAPRFTEADRRAAERLLGAEGTEPWARLGLAEHAEPAKIQAAAQDQLTYWLRLATHPASTSATRDAAEVLAHLCEGLIGHGTELARS